MKTWKELKALVERYDNAFWSLISTNGSRYSPLLEVSGGFDSVNATDFTESWRISFEDEFFPFSAESDTMEGAVEKAHDILLDYTSQVESGNITAHYLTGNAYGNDRKLQSFSVEDCRNWRRWETDFEVFPTKEAALTQQQKEHAIKEARNKK